VNGPPRSVAKTNAVSGDYPSPPRSLQPSAAATARRGNLANLPVMGDAFLKKGPPCATLNGD
jgi:hypothetical protein